MPSRYGGDLRIGHWLWVSGSVAITHDLAPDHGRFLIERKDASLELSSQIMIDPPLEALPLHLVLHTCSAKRRRRPHRTKRSAAPWRSAPDCSLTSCALGNGTCIDLASFLMLAPWPIGDKPTTEAIYATRRLTYGSARACSRNRRPNQVSRTDRAAVSDPCAR